VRGRSTFPPARGETRDTRVLVRRQLAGNRVVGRGQTLTGQGRARRLDRFRGWNSAPLRCRGRNGSSSAAADPSSGPCSTSAASGCACVGRPDPGRSVAGDCSSAADPPGLAELQ
jgi:hypothetical protein